MEVSKNKNKDSLVVAVKGRLDTNTAPELEQSIMSDLEDVKLLKLDLAELDYISSAGLRVVLTLHKTMAARSGSFKVSNPKEEVLEVFDMTGFSSFLNIEE